jgi:hypothetical protein
VYREIEPGKDPGDPGRVSKLLDAGATAATRQRRPAPAPQLMTPDSASSELVPGEPVSTTGLEIERGLRDREPAAGFAGNKRLRGDFDLTVMKALQ